MNKVFLFLLILISSVFASTSPVFNLFPMLVAILIAISIAAIVFLIARLAQSPHLEAWSKNEMSEIFTTILIAFILIGAIFTSNILPTITGHGADYKDYMTGVLDSQREDAIETFYTLSRTNFVLTKYSAYSYSKTTSIPIVDWLFTEFESRTQNFGLGPLVSKFSRSFESLGQAIFILSAQKMILLYLLYAIPIFFFPLAVVLRALPFSRKFGTVLIALCIAGYFIFPLAVVFSGEIYKAILPSDVLNSHLTQVSHVTAAIDPGNVPASGIICEPISAAIAMLGRFGFMLAVCIPACAISFLIGVPWGVCWRLCKVITDAIYIIAVPGFQYVYGNILSGYAVMTGPVFNATYSLITEVILPLVSVIWLLSIITPLIAIILTVASIRSINSALGADIQVFGLSRLI